MHDGLVGHGGLARTFAGGVCGLLYDKIRSALTALLETRWVDVEPELSGEGWAEYQRLCLPESPDFILNLPDYYAFFAYSMFRGRDAFREHRNQTFRH